MLVIYLTITVLIISIVVLILLTRKNNKIIYPAITFIITTIIISSIALPIELSSIPTKNYTRSVIQEYENLNNFIECYGVSGIEDNIIKMNNKIDKNRMYCNNIWVSVWYSKEIGDLNKITCIK